MSDPQLESYEEVPYESNPFPVTHPDGIAVVGLLHGLQPAPASRCRVLELGCAGGGNLIPMAVTLPESRFVGIDLSPRQVAMGQARVDALGLANVELKALSILDVDDSFGVFDYIICHGVFSWVPAPVQDKILAICRRHLAPQGIAYVSYNTYPGWHLWALLRGMLSFHAGHFTDPRTRIHQARAFLSLLGHAVQGADELYARVLAHEAADVQTDSDAYVYHEYLEDVNTPLYFHQFAERAAAHELQYLEEAHLSGPLPSSIPAEVRNIIQRMPVNLIHREQYCDFLRGRSFRCTLLCRAELPLRRPAAPDVLTGLHLTAQARAKNAQPDLSSPAAEDFVGADGRTVSSTDPLVKSALTILSERWPGSLSFTALWQEVGRRLAEAPSNVREGLDAGPRLLAQALLECYAAYLLDLHVEPPRFVLEPGPRPAATPLARLQAAEDRLVATLRHNSVALEPLDRAVLRLLDGARDRQALESALATMAAEGKLDGWQGEPADTASIAQRLKDAVPASLRRLAMNALLID